jgi:hypothetical protein
VGCILLLLALAAAALFLVFKRQQTSKLISSASALHSAPAVVVSTVNPIQQQHVSAPVFMTTAAAAPVFMTTAAPGPALSLTADSNPATDTHPASPLPSGGAPSTTWEVLSDGVDTWYFNRATNETVWELPEGHVVS